jgi:hypothetical protein
MQVPMQIILIVGLVVVVVVAAVVGGIYGSRGKYVPPHHKKRPPSKKTPTTCSDLVTMGYISPAGISFLGNTPDSNGMCEVLDDWVFADTKSVVPKPQFKTFETCVSNAAEFDNVEAVFTGDVCTHIQDINDTVMVQQKPPPNTSQRQAISFKTISALWVPGFPHI